MWRHREARLPISRSQFEVSGTYNRSYAEEAPVESGVEPFTPRRIVVDKTIDGTAADAGASGKTRCPYEQQHSGRVGPGEYLAFNAKTPA